MSKNLLSQKDFKELKTNKVAEPVNELVEPFEKGYMVSLPVLVDKGLVTKFCKAYQDATQKDLRQTRGELSIAEMIVQWAHDNLLTIENLPAVEIVTGVPAQGQAQMQMQAQPMAQPVQPVQAQAQPGAQPAPQAQAPAPQAQAPAPAPQGGEPTAQAAATDVPAQEI